MTDRARWRASLAGGAVVLAAVTALLEGVRRSVADVEAGVEDVWAAGQRLAGVTQITHLLDDTVREAAQLRAAVAPTADPTPQEQ